MWSNHFRPKLRPAPEAQHERPFNRCHSVEASGAGEA